MRVIRKSDLKKFPTKSQDVCRIEEGSTNAYLKEDRAIEAFLKEIEPRYNSALVKLRSGTLDRESILSISGFAAYVATCSPAAMRLNSRFLRETVASTAALLDARGDMPKAADVLGGKSISELLADGTVKIDIDPKFPQALGISNVLHLTSVFGNSVWEVLRNNGSESPFFTSDYPVAMEVVGINSPINRLVPLAPDLAIRIVPDLNLSRQEADLTFGKLRLANPRISRREVTIVNRLIVRCAEDLVFYKNELPWIEKFVNKNREYHIEPIAQTLPTGTGHFIVSTHRVRTRGQSLTSFNL